VGAIVRAESGEQVVTDSVGSFSISTRLFSNLVVEALQYRSKTVMAEPDLRSVLLKPLEEFQDVNVAFRSVQKRNLIDGVSVVDYQEIMEKNYNTGTLEHIDGFVNGFHGNIWGMDKYLVLIDGVPRDRESITPSEIQQISFLKGISAVALYGSQAAKGVVQITTKRGKIQKQQIEVNVNTGIFVPKSYPKYLGSAEYMTLYNEARANDGLGQLYNEETIYNYGSGSNP